MGAWSHEAFGNDSACDWAYGLQEVDDLSLVEAALAAVAPDGYLDASEATEALAAIEVIARLRGHAGYSNAYTEVADDWVAATRLVPSEPLVQRALDVLDRIVGDESELKDLWDDSDSAADWQASLADLRERLLEPPEALPAPLDDIAKVVRGVAGIPFVLPANAADDPFDGLQTSQIFSLVLAAEALGNRAVVRDGIARMWRAVEASGQVKTLWDLAVREAKTWAAEGRLDAALAGLEPWRETAESLAPGTFDMRAMAVYQEAGAYEQAEQLRERLIAAGTGAVMQLIDKALREARAGSASAAQALLDSQAHHFEAEAIKPWRDFTRGILAVRAGQPEGLALLMPWVQARTAQCLTATAVWGFFGIGAGWWALALHQAGRSDDARTVLAAIEPLLLTPENALLVGELRSAGLFDAEVPTLPRPPSPDAEWAGVESDHGVFKTVSVRGVNAIKQVEAFRHAFAQGSGRYPFLIGDSDDLEALLESLEPPEDGGRATLAAAQGLDAAQWLRDHGAAKPPRWRDAGAGPERQVQAQFEVLSGRLKPLMFIGLIELADPTELFARLGYGGWNDCPEPHVHVALHRQWRERFGAEPITVKDNVVECCVSRPPVDRKAALALAAEQAAYCADIVEQGVGSVAALAGTLLEAPVWYFWWD